MSNATGALPKQLISHCFQPVTRIAQALSRDDFLCREKIATIRHKTREFFDERNEETKTPPLNRLSGREYIPTGPPPSL